MSAAIPPASSAGDKNTDKGIDKTANAAKGADPSSDRAFVQAEEVKNASSSGELPSGSEHVSSKGPEEGESQPDILYRIDCENKTILWKHVIVSPENPFEEPDIGGNSTAAPKIVGVLMGASGTGKLGHPLYINPLRSGRVKPMPLDANSHVDGGDEASMGAILTDESEKSISAEDSSEDDPESSSSDHDKSNVHLTTKQQETLKPVLNIGTFRATQVSYKTIDIISTNLVKLLRSVVQDHPKQSLEGDRILVNYPFEMLAHYYKDLVMLRDGQLEHSSENGQESYDMTEESKRSGALDPLDAATKYDLDILLKAFKPIYIKYFTHLESLYKIGTASYQRLWFLFKPGTRVYGMVGGKISGFIFERGEERWHSTKQEKAKEPKSYDAHCWSLTYNGRRIVRTSRIFQIMAFRETRQIVSLAVFPAIYLDSADGGKTKRRLEESGKKFYNIVRQCPAHMQYSGTTWGVDESYSDEKFYKRKLDIAYTGEVVIDPRRRGNYRRRPRVSSNRARRDGIRVVGSSASESSDSNSDYNDDDRVDGHSTVTAALESKELRSAFRSIDPKEKQHLTPQHYFLFPRRMDGFGLAQKERMSFDVENIQPISWPKRESSPMSTLVLDESDKDVIKSLAKKHSRGLGTWGADSIGGKGEGQIFLLHGPPGTGKTFTVECVAGYTRRPLLRLTVADIGTDEREMEGVLGNWFQRGADWGAIILIDEADVFLEKRQVKDLQRNSLVSVFLKCVEYYTGMLFLTTNRIGQIDDAFLSRTSVAITYKTLDMSMQKHIWQGFLKKLADERKDITLTDRAKKFLENLDKDETTKDVPWNGREIRNALQTAIALATFEAEEEAEANGAQSLRITVRPEHFQTVVDRRKEFIVYRKSIRNQDEEARAFTEGSRAPPPKKN